MIRKRNSKWYYIILVKDAQGKTHRIERAGGDTKAECRLAEAKAILENSALDYNPSSDMSISAYMDYWLEKYVSTLSENTQKNYASTVKNHIKPAFKKRRLGSIKPMDIQEFIESKAHMSRGSQDGILRMLHGAFRYAVSPCGFIQHNPCDGIRLPKVSAPKRETTVFSEGELKIIFEKFTQEHDYYLPLQIMYHTGLRIGEALALSWEDIDLNSDILYVHKTMMESGVIQDFPKTKKSNRHIIFSRKLHNLFISTIEKQKQLHGITGRTYRHVCCRADSRRISTSDMRYFNMWCKEEFGHGSLHSFRHTHATMLLEHGEELELVSKRLGHSNITTTANIYSHILDKRNAKLLSALNDF